MAVSGQVQSAARTPAVVICGDADAVAWDQFVSVHPQATGYHTWAWRGVFGRAFGHESIYLAARQGPAIVGVLPLVYIKSLLFGRSLTSLPFLNYGGVVSNSAEASDALLEAAAAVADDRRCRHVELRHTARRYDALPYKQHKVAMHLRLQPDMWEQLDRKVRNQIRKAEKSELSAATGRQELLDEFYRVFARNMRDLGTPVYSRRFFAEVLDALPDRTRIHVVRLRGTAVAAGITHRFRSTVEVPWASSIREYNSLCPNHLLYWDVIQSAVADGSATLDFGRSTPNEGTYKFKEQWGAEPVPLHWEYRLLTGAALPNASPTNPKYSTAIRLWQKIPLPVANWMGPSIVRGIP